MIESESGVEKREVGGLEDDLLRWRGVWAPLRIAFSPIKAFDRWEESGRGTRHSSLSLFIWTLAWLVLLFFISMGVRYGLDQFHGMRPVFGGYWNHPGGNRFGSLRLSPFHLLFAGVQCAVVILIGMLVALRGLRLCLLPRLMVWLFAVAIVATLADVVYGFVWDELLGRLCMMSERWCFELWRLGDAVAYRVHDVVLGLFVGLAVGTVLRRRRWVTPIVAIVVLVASYPLYLRAMTVYVIHVCEPVHTLIAGPELPLAERVAELPECLKIPDYVEEIENATLVPTETAVLSGGPTSTATYVIEPSPDRHQFLNSISHHLESLGWIALKYDPMNTHVEMRTGDDVGWRIWISDSDSPDGESLIWDGWWISGGELVNVILTDWTQEGATQKTMQGSFMHFDKEAAAYMLSAYRQKFGTVPGEASASDLTSNGV